MQMVTVSSNQVLNERHERHRMRRRRCNGRWRAHSVHISQPSRTTQSKARVAPIVCATTFAVFIASKTLEEINIVMVLAKQLVS